MCSRGALLKGIGQAVGVTNLPEVYKRYFGPQETNFLGEEVIGRAKTLYKCGREFVCTLPAWLSMRNLCP